MYDTATGDYWTSNQSISAGESPTTNPEKWDKVEFPYFLAEYVAQSAYAMLTDREYDGSVAAVRQVAPLSVEDSTT